jgi:nickel/cobalt exporter
MWQIITGSFLLSIVHAVIPNHWLPLVAVSKSEQWRISEALGVTAITGVAHTLSTIIIGLIIGRLGFELASRFEFVASVAAPVILVAMGIFYLARDLLRGHHHHHPGAIDAERRTSKKALVVTLAAAMFFSPCIEIEAYYFHAGTHGWQGVLAVSIVYLFITVGGMMFLVVLGITGARKFHSHFLEHHEGKITGLILIASGIFAYFADL